MNPLTATLTRRRLNREAAERWYAARTFADLGELTALWLEGAIASQPGYMPNCGPDPETTELIPTLAAVNRAGYVTNGSQPGLGPETGNGRDWWQRAVVEGFVEDFPAALRLQTALAGTDLKVIVNAPVRGRLDFGPAVVVTGCFAGSTPVGFDPTSTQVCPDCGGHNTADMQTFTEFGVTLGRRMIRSRHLGYGSLCHRTAVNAVCQGLQVTIVDMVWGRNDVLWPALDRWAGR